MQTLETIIKTAEEFVKGATESNGLEADVFGFAPHPLLDFIPVDQAIAHGIADATTPASEWSSKELTRENVLENMQEYMEFAIGKAEDHRGISAERSVIKMNSFLWMLDAPDRREIMDTNYPQYGAPILKEICERYFPDKFTFSTEFLNMAGGKPCDPGCEMGCGL